MHDGRDTPARTPRRGSRLIVSVRDRIRQVVPRGATTDLDEPSEVRDDEDVVAVSPVRAAKPSVDLPQLRREKRRVDKELEALTLERDRLRSERLEVQQVLGEQHGRRVMPRLKVEKTNGTPSFVVAVRMMQRVHRRALDPLAGLDGVGAVFAADNTAETAAFAHSHGVPTVSAEGVTSTAPSQRVIVHALKGVVGLVEVHGASGLRHFDSEGNDPGDVRPAVTYDDEITRPLAFADLCAWSDVLSANIPRPYVQLHFSCHEESAVLDRIDVDPDRIPVLTATWDERLGSVFDGAYSRFLVQPYSRGGLDNRVPGGTFSYEEAR